MQQLIDRFIGYVTIDTQSDPNSPKTPSTDKQWNLARKLAEELQAIGMQEVSIDEKAFVMATLPSNVPHEVPVIGFISHFDTSPDFTAENVRPKIISNYDGKDIVLNAEKNILLSPGYFEELAQYKGQTLITTDGLTLLGADDKAGITEIMAAMEYLINHPEIGHGKIRVAFSPDEEIGRGAHSFDVEKFGADWAYTMDGGPVGELEYESFNAAAAAIIITGKSVHPGSAKNKMVNATRIAAQLIQMIPENEVPERTEGREGFYHLTEMSGDVEQAKLHFIIRDHDEDKFQARKIFIQQLCSRLNTQHPGAVSVEIKDQYYNMRKKIEPVFHVVEIAEKAMKSLGISPIIKPIRGGTDGSILSFKGLPCPNIFAGGHNFHGKYEYVPVESMQKAVEVIVKIAALTAER